MSARIRHTLLTLTLLFVGAVLLVPTPSPAQPLRPQGDGPYGGTPGLHLFLPSNYLDGIHRDRLLFARIRHYNSRFRKSLDAGDLAQALVYTDSLIFASKRHQVKGIRFPDCYKNRAQILKLMGCDSAACVAYDIAVTLKDSVMRFEQSEAIHEMQASYELDRLALEKALLSAHHHKLLFIWLLLLLIAGAIVLGFAYVGNRRTKRLQQELLLKMQHAHDSEKKKTDFINSMCHEVRTPLNGISGFTELLCAEDTTQTTFTQYCEIVQDNRRQLRYLFDDLLEVAYLETLTDPLPRRLVNLSALCRTQLRAMRIRYRKLGVTYVDATPTEPIDVITNEKYLSLMLTALLGNSYKFTQAGEIRIECGLRNEDEVFILITDTGCGIPSEQHDYVFERFTKLDTFSPGNGLGLYLCRQIAGHLRGTIRIDSTYTTGTRIEVTLPQR